MDHIDELIRDLKMEARRLANLEANIAPWWSVEQRRLDRKNCDSQQRYYNRLVEILRTCLKP